VERGKVNLDGAIKIRPAEYIHALAARPNYPFLALVVETRTDESPKGRITADYACFVLAFLRVSTLDGKTEHRLCYHRALGRSSSCVGATAPPPPNPCDEFVAATGYSEVYIGDTIPLRR
jgi:hypothetical protein